MWTRPPCEPKATGNPRRAMLLWAALIIAILFPPPISIGDPLEDGFRIARNKARSDSAAGHIVVVAIDDRSIEEVAGWPWPRRYYAQLSDKLFELGADRVAFNLDFTSRTDRADDRAFQAALVRANGKVLLPARFVLDPATDRRTDVVPISEFRRHAKLVSTSAKYNYRGEVWRLNYGLPIAGTLRPSLAASLADQPSDPNRTFRVDYSIAFQSIPTISAVDVLAGRVSREAIAGKRVIVGPTSPQYGTIYSVPGYSQVSGSYIHALGAETLLKGRQIDLGWLVPFMVSFGLSAIYLFTRNRWLARAAIAVGFSMILIAPVATESRLVFVDVVPSLVLLIAILAMNAWISFRQSYRARGMINSVSGLPNLAALREESGAAAGALVAARIHNYAQITSALPPDSEKALVEQIAARLAVGAGGSTIHQGDEGIFVWLATAEASASIGDQLEALHALCRTPIVVAGTHVDLAVTFGVDAGERSISSRIGSALVAADEAAAEGQRWKEFDAAKLKDAAWKLSLLGRLDAAIDSGEIWVAYQPKLDLASKRIVGAEALARWSHPEKGAISPAEFILTAEQHNRIEKLTDYILDEAIRAGAVINRESTSFEVAVNLSARLLDNMGLVDRVSTLLANHRLPASHLTLEVTESAAMSGSERSIEVLGRLRALGVNISVDDYGTGFSTLEALKKIPANEIKIDMGFVRMIDRSQSDRLMVNSTIQLAHSLGRTVVAEGVESPDVLSALEVMGCDRVQGYLVGRPMPLNELRKLLPARLASTAA